MFHGSKKNEDGVIDLRISSDAHPARHGGRLPQSTSSLGLTAASDAPEFRINRVTEERHVAQFGDHAVLATPLSDQESATMKANDKVKVKFDKFVNLIATHAYQEIFDKHVNEDVIISTDLLADLANAHEEKDDGKKIPLYILMGVLLGVMVTWFILKSNV